MDMKLTLVGTWFGASFFTFIFALFLLIYTTTPKISIPKNTNFKLYAALPPSQIQITDQVVMADARAQIIEQFFNLHNSPLAIHSGTFVMVADHYNLDYRLLPAIAMQESSGGKKVIIDSYNPFGFGIYGDTVTRFADWDDAIEKVARTLRSEYINKGLITPYQIMTKYTPPSVEKGGPWAIGVESFMEELN
jgi:hypothetical protein